MIPSLHDSKNLEARGGIEPPIRVLQTLALPLGDRATDIARAFRRYVLRNGSPKNTKPADQSLWQRALTLEAEQTYAISSPRQK
jgi:hypothetical protein